ncbi:unnamed protein product [Rotaria magnacalcarata]|nr:unnamed protein product [Rotaria magnacalcarata]
MITKLIGGSIPDPLPRWNFRKADWSTFYNNCATFSTIGDFDEPDAAVAYLVQHILDACTSSIPCTTPQPLKKSVPWWTPECRAATSRRKAASRRLFRHPSQANRNLYLLVKAQCRRTIRQARRTSWQNFVSTLNSQTPMTSVWKKVRKFSGNYVPSPTPVLKINGMTVANQEAVAEVLADSLASVSDGSLYSENFKKKNSLKHMSSINFSTSEDNLYNRLFTIQELTSALSTCSNTAPGPDTITYQMLKHLPGSLLTFLLDLYNLIWVSGRFPTQWEEAIILPFPKPGKDHTDPLNYRPIALTNCLCKLMEKMVCFRLTWYLEANNILAASQFGFRQFRSTLDPLVLLENSIGNAFRERKILLAVFFDLEKAYDTTWRFGIVKTLFDIGLRGALPIFIRGFLSKRQFQMRVGSTLSQPRIQKEGVTQGSIVSVLSFALSINGIMSTLPPSISSLLYVDDFTLYCVAARLESGERQMQMAVNRVSEWADDRGFRFSVAKTVSMVFTRRRNIGSPTLNLYGIPLRSVMETRFLGLIFDRRLTWVPHLKNVRNSCLKSMDLLKAISHSSWGADRITLQRLYKALIMPKIMYGCQVYGSASNCRLKILDPVHNLGLRLITGAFRSSPVVSLYTECGDCPLEIHRDEWGLRYLFRIPILPKSKLSLTILPAIERNDNFELKQLRPFSSRISQILTNLPLDASIVNILPYRYDQIPPWIIPKIQVCSIASKAGSKNHTHVSIMQNSFLEHQYLHTGAIPIYTDGSKSSAGVGCAAVFPSIILSCALHPLASIFTAELYAILGALREIIQSPDESFVIYSDSLSAIQTLTSLRHKNPLIMKIQQWLFFIAAKHKKVCFCWVPGHTGVAGNELADAAAKAAVNSPTTQLQIPHSDFKHTFRKYALDQWQEKWDSFPNNKLKTIKPYVTRWNSPSYKSRRDETVIARLRIGHTRLTHGYLMESGVRPYCLNCIVPLTVEHILVECPDFQDHRRTYFSRLSPVNLCNILAEGDSFNAHSIIQFLSTIGLIDRI